MSATDTVLAQALRLQLEWGVDECLAREAAARWRVPGRPALASTPGPARAAAIGATADDTMDAWRRDLAGGDGAGLAATATHLVWPIGRLDQPSLFVLAEAPGPDEDRGGQGFSGPAGNLARRMIGSIGVGEDSLLLAYVVPWRPPGGRPVSDLELAACLPFLHRLTRLVRPRLALALGGVAGRALAGDASRRRRWSDAAIGGLETPFPVLATFAPAALLAQPSLKAAAWGDLRMLRRRIDGITDS